MAKRVAVSSNFRSRKCAKAEYLSEDRISLLPDDILVIILSLLTVKEAARTSVLSKKWINLWMLIFRLDFDPEKLLYEMIIVDIAGCQRSLERERRKYVKQVNKVLQLNKVLALDYFRICFDLDKSSKIEIDKWLEYAFARRVQRLELDLEAAVKFPSEKSYTFPYGPLELSCRNSTEESRSVYSGVNPCVSINFESLKELCLRCVNVAGEVLQLFLRKCPFLESLVVHCSMDLINLEVCGPSLALKYLEISFCPKMEYIKVCDTNLVSLKVRKAQKLVLENVPMLVEVDVEGATMNDIRVPMSWLSCCLSQLEVLTISTFPFQNKAKLCEFPQLTRLKQLTIRAPAYADVGIMEITPLLAASPNLEKFVMKWSWETPRREKRKLEKGVIFPLQHLKVVEFQGYYGRTTDLELVKYFLENAVALEKITVDPHEVLSMRLPAKWYLSYQTEKIETARSFAKKQLQKLISPNIELEIL